MTSPKIINIDDLLLPISEERPQGQDIREDSGSGAIYYQIKDARNSARAAERASLFDPDQASNIMGEWLPILDLAPTILKQHAKDLEVTSWLIEALIRFHGYAGLRDGFTLARRLVEQYWDNLYPVPDEDGIETKVAPLSGLNGDSGEGTLLAPIRNAQITIDASTGSFSYWQYQQARDVSKIADPDKRQEKENALQYSLKSIETAVNEAPGEFYPNLVADIESSIADFKAMNTLLRQHCGHQAPPFSLIADTLEEILRAVRFLAKDKLVAEVSADEPADTQPGTEGAAVPRAAAGTSGPISSRDDALRKLEEVARYFRATEPHTPLVSGIERLVRWGRMPMAELILELVPDQTARAFYQHLTGASLFKDDEGQAAASSYAATANIGNTSNAGHNFESSEDDGGLKF